MFHQQDPPLKKATKFSDMLHTPWVMSCPSDGFRFEFSDAEREGEPETD